MELIIKKAKEIKVIPSCLQAEDAPPAFIFREPNALEIAGFYISGGGLKPFNSILSDCFLRFENKLIIKDEKGEEIQYNSYEELLKLSGISTLTNIHQDCVAVISQKINELQTEVKKTEKKLK